MREEAKYNSERWEYTSKYLYDKFNGKLDDPNLINRGITGFTFSPERESRQLKIKDINSGNIEFDTEKVIAQMAQEDTIIGVSGRKFSPVSKHRRNQNNLSSIQVIIGQDLNQPKENI